VKICVRGKIYKKFTVNKRLRARSYVSSAEAARLFAGFAGTEHSGKALCGASAEIFKFHNYFNLSLGVFFYF